MLTKLDYDMRLKWISNIAMYHPSFAPDIEYHTDEDSHYPPIDMIITDGEIHIWADLPGVKNEDINLYIQGEVLVIKGVKQSYYPQKEQYKIFHRVERQSTPFCRVLKLQSYVNEDSVFSKLENGVLHIFWKR